MIFEEALKIIGISRNYTPVELKKKYKSLAIRYHPDKYSGDPSTFLKINEAYNLLLKRTESDIINNNIPNENNPFFHDLNEIFNSIFNSIPSGINLQNPRIIRIVKINDFNNNNFNNFNNNNNNNNFNDSTIINITIKEYLLGFTKTFIKKIDCECDPEYCKTCLSLGFVNGTICTECVGAGYSKNCGKCKYGIVDKNITIKFKKKINLNKKYHVLDKTIKFNLIYYSLIDDKLLFTKKINVNNNGLTFNFTDPYDKEHNIDIKEQILNNDIYHIIDNIHILFNTV